ncbi:unnamed protein product [Gadus morhua 'NCC']
MLRAKMADNKLGSIGNRWWETGIWCQVRGVTEISDDTKEEEGGAVRGAPSRCTCFNSHLLLLLSSLRAGRWEDAALGPPAAATGRRERAVEGEREERRWGAGLLRTAAEGKADKHHQQQENHFALNQRQKTAEMLNTFKKRLGRRWLIEEEQCGETLCPVTSAAAETCLGQANAADDAPWSSGTIRCQSRPNEAPGPRCRSPLQGPHAPRAMPHFRC